MESLTESQENSRKLWETGKLHWFDFQYEEKRSIQQWFVSSGSALFFSGAYPVVFHLAADFHFSRPHGLRCKSFRSKYKRRESFYTLS